MGFGTRPGERETWVHGPDTDARTPWQQYTIQCVACGLLLLLAYFAVVLVVLWDAGYGHYNPPRVGFWLAAWRAIKDAAWFVARSALVPFVLWVAPVGWFTYELVWKRMRPSIIAPGWPAASGPGDPAFAPETFAEARRAMYEPEEDEEPQQIERVLTVHVQKKTHDGYKEQRAQFSDTQPLAQFSRAASNGQAFTERTARRFGMTRDEFNRLRDAFLNRGWAIWKNADHHEQGVLLEDEGRQVLSRIGWPAPEMKAANK